jgi:hypothetical protein
MTLGLAVKGDVVDQVVPGGPAMLAGLKKGDKVSMDGDFLEKSRENRDQRCI